MATPDCKDKSGSHKNLDQTFDRGYRPVHNQGYQPDTNRPTNEAPKPPPKGGSEIQPPPRTTVKK